MQAQSVSDDLSWIEDADAKIDFQHNVREKHDTRFIAICGLGARIPGAEDASILVDHYGYRCITSCMGAGQNYPHLLDLAREYARQYNEQLMKYFYSDG